MLRQRLAEPQPKFRLSFLAITRKPTRAVRNRGTGPRRTQCWVCFVSRLDATYPTGQSRGRESSTLQRPRGPGVQLHWLGRCILGQRGDLGWLPELPGPPATAPLAEEAVPALLALMIRDCSQTPGDTRPSFANTRAWRERGRAAGRAGLPGGLRHPWPPAAAGVMPPTGPFQ